MPTKESSTGFKRDVCGVTFESSFRIVVPCRIVYGVSAEGSASRFESAEGAATPRLPGPSWFDPSACASSLCLKNALCSCASASRAAQHSSGVGRCRCGYGESGAPASDAAATATSLLGVAGVLTTADDAGFVFARERFTGVAVCFFAPGSGFTSTQASSVFTKFRAVLLVLGLLAGGVTGVPPRVPRRVAGAMMSATFHSKRRVARKTPEPTAVISSVWPISAVSNLMS